MLTKKKMILCFDIDGVICKTNGNNYKNAKPIKKNVKFINYLFERGFIIKLFTARFMGRNNDRSSLAEKKAKILTTEQLNKWGLKYSKLIFGKPSYDIFIDDKNLNFQKNWSIILKQKLNIK
tara:strand:+ start:10 stop:375 length:366 start_codon:yes stop_codon:yes gene_type:complete